MSQENNRIASDKALLVEYQVCRTQADSLSLSHWTFSGILLGLSTAAFGIIIPNIFSKPSISFKIFVTIICAGAIAINMLIHGLLSRTSERNKICYRRMEEIEEKLGMDIQHRQKNYKGQRASFYWNIIIWILSIFWALAVVFVWSCHGVPKEW